MVPTWQRIVHSKVNGSPRLFQMEASIRGLAAAPLVYRCNLPCLRRLLLRTAHILQKDSLKEINKGHGLHLNENIKRESGMFYDVSKKNLRTRDTTIKTEFFFCNWFLNKSNSSKVYCFQSGGEMRCQLINPHQYLAQCIQAHHLKFKMQFGRNQIMDESIFHFKNCKRPNLF